MSLRGSSQALAEAYDVGLFDLDGVIYVGDEVVAHAADAVSAAEQLGMRRAYVTNNAARTPEQVAQRLAGMGVPAQADEVVTSAQAAARVLAAELAPGSAVLVGGGEGLIVAVRDVGLTPVRSLADLPLAVVNGHDPSHTWALIDEACLALQAGLPWIVSNVDLTIPNPRGRLPGSGAVVALLSAATGRRPDIIAGKPHPALHRESMERTQAKHPLIIGDRLDTDIEGALAAGVDSLLVLTGVTGLAELLLAPAKQRPTYLATDLRGLLSSHPEPATSERQCTTGTARATRDGTVIRVTGADPDDRLRAACVLALAGGRRGRRPGWPDRGAELDDRPHSAARPSRLRRSSGGPWPRPGRRRDCRRPVRAGHRCSR